MRGTCPWCQRAVEYIDVRAPQELGQIAQHGSDADPDYLVTETRRCPACSKLIAYLEVQLVTTFQQFSGAVLARPGEDAIVFPAAGYGHPAQPQVPVELIEDYEEARRILTASPKAAAALARRALQQLIRATLGHTKKNLYLEIEAVLDDGTLPTAISEQLHAIREIGNLGAHPLIEPTTGTILPVEPEEAQWLLDVLYDLFDHCFVKPAAAAGRIAAMKVKLGSLKKPGSVAPQP